MIAPSITEALAFAAAWRAAGHPVKQDEIVPPCDELGDEVHDTYLAVTFRRLAAVDTLTERVMILARAIDLHQPMIARCRAAEETALAERLERMVAVYRKWSDEIVSQSAIGRAA